MEKLLIELKENPSDNFYVYNIIGPIAIGTEEGLDYLRYPNII